MAQNTVNYANNPTGPQLLDDYLAKEQENDLSSNSGIQRPSYASAGTVWLDTSVTPWLYKIYDGSDDAIIGAVNPTTHMFIADSVDESNLVHKTGDETISGAKTFIGSGWITKIKNNSVTYDTAPLSNTNTTIAFVDENDDSMGVVECRRNTDNSTMMLFNVYGANGSWASDTLRLKVLEDGETRASAPIPSDTTSTSSAQIATTGWVNTLGNNVVHLSGSETISGTKTFNGAVYLPNGTIIQKQDNNVEGGEIKFQRANNDPLSQNAALDLYNGVMRFLYCNGVQVPATDANNCAVNTVNKSKNATGYFQLGNGLILNWGHALMNNNTTTTMNFAKAFTSEMSYGMTQGYWSPESNRQDPLTITARSTTGFTIRNTAGGGSNYCYWVAIGY